MKRFSRIIPLLFLVIPEFAAAQTCAPAFEQRTRTLQQLAVGNNACCVTVRNTTTSELDCGCSCPGETGDFYFGQWGCNGNGYFEFIILAPGFTLVDFGEECKDAADTRLDTHLSGELISVLE